MPKAREALRKTQPIISIPFPRPHLDEEPAQLTDSPPELDSPYVGYRSTKLSKRKRQEIINPLIFTEERDAIQKKGKERLINRYYFDKKRKSPLPKERKKKLQIGVTEIKTF